jgi:hypothetical protein
MPQFIIPPSIHEKIQTEGLHSVLTGVRTARGRGWDFTITGEVKMVLLTDMTYAYLYVISSGANARAYNAALAPINKVSPPFKKFLLWNWRKEERKENICANAQAFVKACGDAPVRENAVILPNRVEGLIAEYVVTPPIGFRPMAAKSWVTAPNFAEFEPKILRA